MLASPVFESIYDLALLVGYFVGSIPTAFIIARFCGVKDIRKEGSGNVGSTNVGRVCGAAAGSFSLLLDVAKPVAALLVLYALRGDTVFEQGSLVFAISSLGVILGQCFPVWLGFKGGKGLACFLGFWLVLSPIATILAFVLLISLLSILRRRAIPYTVYTISTPAFYFFLQGDEGITKTGIICLIMVAVVVLRHSENIVAFITGREARLSLKGKA